MRPYIFLTGGGLQPSYLTYSSILQGVCLNSIPYCFYMEIRTYVTLKRFPDLWILNVYFLDTGHDLVQSLEITESIRLFIVIWLCVLPASPGPPDCFQVAFKSIFRHLQLKAFQSCIKTNECVGFLKINLKYHLSEIFWTICMYSCWNLQKKTQ